MAYTFNKAHAHAVLQIEFNLECQSDLVIGLILKHEDKTNLLANKNRFKVMIKLRKYNI